MTEEEWKECALESVDMLSWNTRHAVVRLQAARGTGPAWRWQNSQSFCASPPSCSSRWPSCCQTCRRGSSRPVQRTGGEKKEQRCRSRYWDQMVLGHYYQLVKTSSSHAPNRRLQVDGGLKVACVCKLRRSLSSFTNVLIQGWSWIPALDGTQPKANVAALHLQYSSVLWHTGSWLAKSDVWDGGKPSVCSHWDPSVQTTSQRWLQCIL